MATILFILAAAGLYVVYCIGYCAGSCDKQKEIDNKFSLTK